MRQDFNHRKNHTSSDPTNPEIPEVDPMNLDGSKPNPEQEGRCQLLCCSLDFGMNQISNR